MFPRLISNSGKRKSEKNQFANFLEFFEDFDEVFFLDFSFTKWAKLALSKYDYDYLLQSIISRQKIKFENIILPDQFFVIFTLSTGRKVC